MGVQAEVVYRNEGRLNGWSLPLHPFQAVAWAFLLYFALYHFVTIVPGLPPEWQPAAIISVGIVVLFHIIVHLACVSINPADKNVIEKCKKGKHKIGEFDRTQHRHVIENMHCYICECDVGAKSKHCSACNKCVGDFDHHCKWLNNCIGGRNYRLFLITLGTGLVGCLLPCVLAITMFVGYFTDRHNGQILKAYKDFLEAQRTTITDIVPSDFGAYVTNITTPSMEAFDQLNSTDNILEATTETVTIGAPPLKPVFYLFYGAVPDEVWLTFMAVTALLGLVAVGLLAHLLGFHAYLIWRGLSTYDYIVMEREKAEAAAREPDTENQNYEQSSIRCKPNKANQVAPQTDEYELGSERSTAKLGGCYDYRLACRLSGRRESGTPGYKMQVDSGFRTESESEAVPEVMSEARLAISAEEIPTAGAVHGGILAEHERALREAERGGDETPPPASTPPNQPLPSHSPKLERRAKLEQPSREKGDRRRSRSRDTSQRENPQHPQPRKKKKKIRQPSDRHRFQDADHILMGNGVKLNGHLPSLDDASDLREVIRRGRSQAERQSIASADQTIELAQVAADGIADLDHERDDKTVSDDAVKRLIGDGGGYDIESSDHDFKDKTSLIVPDLPKLKKPRRKNRCMGRAVSDSQGSEGSEIGSSAVAGCHVLGSGVGEDEQEEDGDDGRGGTVVVGRTVHRLDHDGGRSCVQATEVKAGGPLCSFVCGSVDKSRQSASADKGRHCGSANIQQEAPGVYTPSSYAMRLDVDPVPSTLIPLPPPPPIIRPAAPIADYNSDSAESLTEIPVAQTHIGSLYNNHSPRGSNIVVTNGGFNPDQADTNGNHLDRTQKTRKHNAKRHKRPSPRGKEDDSGTRHKVNGVTETHSDHTKTVAAGNTEALVHCSGGKRHQAVPPLDLTSLDGDSAGEDGEEDDDIVSAPSKKVRHRKQVSQI